MHFAVGMGCGGGGAVGICVLIRRGWRWLPAIMSLGGIWALVPDLPRVFREDFPGLPLASWLGAKGLERWLHQHGDLFFFHSRLDAGQHEWALHGLALILLFYNVSIVLLMVMERRQRRRDRSGSDGTQHRRVRTTT